MASNKATSLPTQPQTAVLNQECADSELACQMQLDEVLATSLGLALPSGSLTHGTTDSITQEDNYFYVGETSGFPGFLEVSSPYRDKPQDAECIGDDPVLLYNYIFGQQGRADELNQDQDDVFEALKEQYRLFDLKATSQKDRRLARQLSSLPEDEWGPREENPGTSFTFQSEDVRNSNFTTVGSYLPPREVCDRNLPNDSEAGHTTCIICLTTEITPSNSRVVSEKCLHRFCTDCLRQYGEMMVKSGKSQIPCPEYECEESWSTKMCEFLLSSDALLILNRRQVEDALADWERVYCPYKDCSWLQLRPLSPRPDQPPPVGGLQCLSCHRYFCLECQVPWHDNLTCEEYKGLPEEERSLQDIALLKGLAVEKKWQRCTCGHVVEKTEGCNHITCRCGKEFCYICGQEWTNHLSNLHSCRRP